MSLERALQLNTAALAVAGAMFLGLGHQSLVMPLVLAVAAAVAVGVTDVFGWVRLHRGIANAIAVAAVVWSLRNFLDLGSENQLLAIADMLVCLQLVLLFQEKTHRVHWQLLVLSLLQVVVAAALDLGPQFGLLIAVYVTLALNALVLLCIQRELLRHAPRADRPAAADGEGQRLLAPPLVTTLAISAEQRRRELPGRLLARQVALLAGVGFLFSTVFFCAAPRLTDASWTGPRGSGPHTSGFAPEIRLDEGGRIHLSGRVVMRVMLTRLVDRKPEPLVGEPYFHGWVLTHYVQDESGGRWVAAPNRPAFRVRPPPIFLGHLVRQDIVLESSPSGGVFAIVPVERLNETPNDVRYSRSSHRVYRSELSATLTERQLRYAFATPAIRNGRQLPAIPHYNPNRSEVERAALFAELDELSQFDFERFPRLAETAAEALREQRLEQASALERATALERHFRLSDRYQYSLQLDFERDPALDPIEDFVANHRTGHCEYFASALVMMLRSQGIPARLVVGYKGGDFNTLGSYYVVQQRHAHAWVEAWLPPGEVDKGDLAGPASDGGSWLRLDPTPGSRGILIAEEEESWRRRVAQAFDYVDLLWRDYVLSLNAARQQDSFFDPLTAKATALPAFLESRNFQRWLRRWSAEIGLPWTSRGASSGRPALEGLLAIAVAAVLLAVFVLVQGVQLAHRGWRRWRLARQRERAAVRRPPAFYRRLERVLGRLPLHRGCGQTPQEFAAAAGDRLQGRGAAVPAAPLPAEIVAAYYRVRFGGEHLDKNETQAIEQALEALVPAVSQAKQR